MGLELEDLGNNEKEEEKKPPKTHRYRQLTDTEDLILAPRPSPHRNAKNPLDRSRIRTPTIMAQSLTSDERPHVHRRPEPLLSRSITARCYLGLLDLGYSSQV